MSSDLSSAGPKCSGCERAFAAARHCHCPVYAQHRTAVCQTSQHTVKSHPLHSAVAGALASGVGVLTVTPLEVVKVQLQTGSRSVRGTVSKLIATKGVSALWAGLVPTLALVLPMSALYQSAYVAGRDSLAGSFEDPDTAQAVAPVGAAFVSRATCTVLSAPLELVRTNIQSSAAAPGAGRGAFGIIKDITAQHGVRGLYRGLGATLMRDIPSTVAYWGMFEYLSRKDMTSWATRFFTPAADAADATDGQPVHTTPSAADKGIVRRVLAAAPASICAACCSALAVTPADVVVRCRAGESLVHPRGVSHV